MQVESTLMEKTKVTQTVAPQALTGGYKRRPGSPGNKNFGGISAALLQSRFTCALVAFFALCLLTAAGSFEKLKPADFAFNTWTTWSIKDYLGHTKAPDVVFLGSSLMLVPLDGVDADYMRKDIDAARHHQSLFFENHFKKYTGKEVSSFNFALPGEMPSDAYLITRFLLEGKKAPKVLVYGVGPRDFMDNLYAVFPVPLTLSNIFRALATGVITLL